MHLLHAGVMFLHEMVWLHFLTAVDTTIAPHFHVHPLLILPLQRVPEPIISTLNDQLASCLLLIGKPKVGVQHADYYDDDQRARDAGPETWLVAWAILTPVDHC